MNNNQATIEKLERMGLHGMVRAFKQTMETGIKHSFTADELLTHLVDAQWDDRNNRRIARLLKAARFRYQASFQEIDFSITRNMDKNQMLRFSDCGWISKHQDIILTGPSGCGKSFVASALGNQACLYGLKVGYYPCSKLLTHLRLAKNDGSYPKELIRIQKQDLIILDDFGLEVIDVNSRVALLEIFEDRHSRKSTIVVSQLPINKWHEVIGDPTIADAICDRIIHTAHRVELKGESVRKLYSDKEVKS